MGMFHMHGRFSSAEGSKTGRFQVNPPKMDLLDYWDALDDAARMKPDAQMKDTEADLSPEPSCADTLN